MNTVYWKVSYDFLIADLFSSHFTWSLYSIWCCWPLFPETSFFPNKLINTYSFSEFIEYLLRARHCSKAGIDISETQQQQKPLPSWNLLLSSGRNFGFLSCISLLQVLSQFFRFFSASHYLFLLYMFMLSHGSSHGPLLLVLCLLSQCDFASSHNFNFHLHNINNHVNISILSIRSNF